jgi:uncharacterized protein (DUF58 family)
MMSAMRATTPQPAFCWPPHGPGVARIRLEDLLALEAAGSRLALRRTGSRELGEGLSRRLRARGLSYAESRPYQTGDDARSIDWRVTARTARTHTKLFDEEREQPVWICVDLRDSMHFATRVAFKSVFAAHVAALLAWSALAAGDRVGCLVWTGAGPVARPPRRGRPALLAALTLLARADLAASAASHHGDRRIPATAAGLIAAAGSRTRLHVLSDFIGFDDDHYDELRSLAHRHTLCLAQVVDPFEESPPALTGAWLTDASGHSARFDPGSVARRADAPGRLRARLETLAAEAGAGCLTVLTTDPPLGVAERMLGGAGARGARGSR